MTFLKKTKHEPMLTESDRERLARASESESHKQRKAKACIHLKKTGWKQELAINVYAPDEEKLKAEISDRVKWFQEAEPKAGWKLVKIDWLSRDVNEVAEEEEK